MSFSLLPTDLHRLLFSYSNYRNLCRLLCLQQKFLTVITRINKNDKKNNKLNNTKFLSRLTNLSIVLPSIEVSSLGELIKLANHPSLYNFTVKFNFPLSEDIASDFHYDFNHGIRLKVDFFMISEFLKEYFSLSRKDRYIQIFFTLESDIRIGFKKQICQQEKASEQEQKSSVLIYDDHPNHVCEYNIVNRFIEIIKKYVGTNIIRLACKNHLSDFPPIKVIDHSLENLDEFDEEWFDSLFRYILTASNKRTLKKYRLYLTSYKPNNIKNIQMLLYEIKGALYGPGLRELEDKKVIQMNQDNSLEILDIPIPSDVDLGIVLRYFPNLKTVGLYCNNIDEVNSLMCKCAKLNFILYCWKKDYQLYVKLNSISRTTVKILENERFIA